jgi:hypothetical protein
MYPSASGRTTAFLNMAAKGWYVLALLMISMGVTTVAVAQDDASVPGAWEYLSDKNFSGWTGIKPGAENGLLPCPGQAVFQYPAGKKGWYSHGFSKEHDGTRDWRKYYGLQLNVKVPAGRILKLKAILFTPPKELRQEYLPSVQANVEVPEGWHQVTIAWESFDLPPGQFAMLKFIQGIRLEGRFKDNNGAANLNIKNVRLTLARQIAMTTAVQGRAGEGDSKAKYEVQLTNCTDVRQAINLLIPGNRFNTMHAKVTPSTIALLPGKTASCIVTVEIPNRGHVLGGHESQTLMAMANGNAAGKLELITACAVPHPYLIHTASGWSAVRDKATKYSWAAAELKKLTKELDGWQVPPPYFPPANYNAAEKHFFVYKDEDYVRLQNAAFGWQLTRDEKFARKVANMLVQFADEKTGYPYTWAATNNGGPQEGEDFQRIAIAYDAILDAGILKDAEKTAIERCLRLYMNIFETDLTVGNMGNWSTSQSTAALFCALAMGDLKSAERYIYGPSGYTDFLSKGVMDDGWWWEVSTGYNLWVATELTQAALACRPWGYDLINLKVPANTSPYAIVTPWALNPPYGISFEKWGPLRCNTRSIKQLWDAIPLVADYRGITFGMNDGHEEKVSGLRMELAYAVYRDPAFAGLVKLGNSRDLIYGVPELPVETPALYGKSAYAENIGYALLRSQTKGRQPKDQIQAVMKIGTQGGFHGHFDRVSLDNITRYGRSFWNPETIWWGYPNFMYKFYVQSSVNHNMVVVDQKQQEAVPSRQILFHSGAMMQVAAQQTIARWSDPPYLGMQYANGETARDQMKKDKQSLPPVTDRRYGELGPFTEPVLQRRVAIVTDDYVVLADYLQAEKPHVFDNLLQMRQLTGLTANNSSLQPVRHNSQLSDDPHSAAQLITDVNWYQTEAPVRASFQFDYGAGADNSGTRELLNEPGTLRMDVHNLWPKKQEILVAMPPETHDSQQWVKYTVTGDGKELASGESGIWILGEKTVDVPVDGLNELSLQVNTAGGKKKSLFWANARLLLADGTEIRVKDMAISQNTEQPPLPGLDYYKGPIKIAGNAEPYAIAAQPIKNQEPGIIRINLSGRKAVRFKATLGGDFPFGPEDARRRVYGSRITGKTARFLTIIEPYEDHSLIKRASAEGPDSIKVELTDGRIQYILISNMEGSGKDIKVAIKEYKNGKEFRTESTTQ